MYMGYAYKDKYGIIHVAGDRRTAVEYAKWDGKVIEYRLEHGGGYPVFDGRALIIYTKDGVRVKHAGRLYGRGAWPAGTGFIRDALKELI